MHRAILLLGSNLGERESMLFSASMMIREQVGDVVQVSSIFETEPWGFKSPSYFLNQVLKVNTLLSPHHLLYTLKKIEKELGRVKSYGKVTSRCIDIDILLFDDLILNERELIIPHQQLHKRRFALMPLAEIAGELLHPLMGKSIGELLADCDDPLEVYRFKEKIFSSGQ